jgi:hypothetical protein
MDSKKDSEICKTATEAETDNAEKAFEEYQKTGATSRRCLRCGGKFLFYEGGSAYAIWCETENCFKMTARGI